MFKEKLKEQKWFDKHTERLSDLLYTAGLGKNIWDAFESFVDVLKDYEADIKSGKVIREEKLTGRFEYQQVVTGMEWDRIKAMIKVAREHFELEPENISIPITQTTEDE